MATIDQELEELLIQKLESEGKIENYTPGVESPLLNL